MTMSTRRSAAEQQRLLAIARRAITAQVSGGVAPDRDGVDEQPRHGDPHARSAGVFVTLHDTGELRGCIGHMAADEPLVPALIDAATAACSRDPRFPPVRPDEL